MAAVSPERLIARAEQDPIFERLAAQTPFRLLAVGKAAAPMASAWLRHGLVPAYGLVVGTHRGSAPIGSLVWRRGGHPVPDDDSVLGAQDALALASTVERDGYLVVLLSGGTSAVMAMPQHGLSIEDKRTTVSVLLQAGADIQALNTVRKHLSGVKGGRLAAACRGTTWTLAVSDVVGDDPGVIGSGPTVPDSSTFADALRVIEELNVASRLPRAVVSLIEAGARGRGEESVKPGDPRLARSVWRMVGGRMDAMAGAKEAASSLGYHAVVLTEPIVGIARQAASEHVRRILGLIDHLRRPACVISSGETTVKVLGDGIGGRNQELVLSAALSIDGLPTGTTIASAGTDGVDGPTTAAGAIADSTTLARARSHGLDPIGVLARNDSNRFFEPLGDLIVTGPTDTNVGDVQVVLVP